MTSAAPLRFSSSTSYEAIVILRNKAKARPPTVGLFHLVHSKTADPIGITAPFHPNRPASSEEPRQLPGSQRQRMVEPRSSLHPLPRFHLFSVCGVESVKSGFVTAKRRLEGQRRSQASNIYISPSSFAPALLSMNAVMVPSRATSKCIVMRQRVSFFFGEPCPTQCRSTACPTPIAARVAAEAAQRLWRCNTRLWIFASFVRRRVFPLHLPAFVQCDPVVRW